MHKVLLMAALCLNLGRADEEIPKDLPFEVSSVIDASIANLDPPRWYPEVVSWSPAIIASEEIVQKHVVQGMALVHAGWDFEAYRHFAEAAKKDPNCLMAYWGISLSLANPNGEIIDERYAAIGRMLDLLEKGAGNDNERAQAEALAFLFSEEPQRAPEVFEAVAKEFPNNLQMGLMAAFMKRDGYDVILGPGQGQREAIALVEGMLEDHPESQMALSFWVALHAENPDGAGQLRSKVLPRVRMLAKKAPEFPPYCELLGHFEWRSGNLRLARDEFKKAISLYEKGLKEEGLGFEDCPNLIRSKIYLATVQKGLDEMDEAFAIASELRSLPIQEARISSPGITLLLWEGKTLASRLYLARGDKGDFKNGLEALPSKKEGAALSMKTPAIMAWEAWRQALAARNAIDQQVEESAADYLAALAASDALLNNARPVVTVGSGRQEWARTRQALKVEWYLAKGELLEITSEKGGRAAFWLQSAVDEREPPKGVFPPVSLASPRLALARFQDSKGEFELARESYKAALKEFPNDVQTLNAYANWLQRRGEDVTAKSIRKHIEIVKGRS